MQREDILPPVFGVRRLDRDRRRVVIQPETLTCEDDRPLIAKQKPGVTGADKRGGPRVPDRSNSPLVLNHSLGVSRSGPGNGRLFALKRFPRRLQLAADLTDPSRSHVEQFGGRLGRFADGQNLGNLSLPWGEYIQPSLEIDPDGRRISRCDGGILDQDFPPSPGRVLELFQ